MAPIDRLSLPFRWAFVPVRDPRDGAIRWKWQALTQNGQLALESEGTFDTLSECMQDARTQGYGSGSAGDR